MKKTTLALTLLLAACSGTSTTAGINEKISEVKHLDEVHSTSTTEVETKIWNYEGPELLESHLTTTTEAPVVTAPPPPPPTTAPPPPPPPPPAPKPKAVASNPGNGKCGGNLPPCSVMNRESGGDPHIWNGSCYAPSGHQGTSPCGSSSASGKWQMVRGTWQATNAGRSSGYANAADAPEHIQDAAAAELWAGGRGCSHWAQC